MGMQGAIGRREFLRRVAAAAAAYAVAPNVVTKRSEKTLRILQWSHFVPAYDTWFDRYASEWGKRNGIEVTVDHIALADLAARANAEVAAQSGHDLFQFLSPPAAFEEQVLDVGDVVKEAERRNGPILELCRRSAFNPVTKRWLGVSTKPPVPGVEASTKVSGDTHSALPVVSTTRLRETPFFASFAGSTSTCSCRSR